MTLRNILRTSLLTTIGTTASLILQGHRQGSSAAPLNAVSHILWGEKAPRQTRVTSKYTLVGTLLNAAAMAGWSVVFEGLLSKYRRNDASSAVAAGAAMSAVAYATDYHVVPKSLTPGFEHVLPPRSMWIVYGVLAATFAAAALMGDRD